MSTKILGDKIFAGIVALLLFGGLAIFLSASLGLLARDTSSVSYLAFKQLGLGLIPGLLLLITLRFTPPKVIEKYIPLFYVSAVRSMAPT